MGMISSAFGTDALDSALQAKIDARFKVIQAWAAGDPVIVSAVKAQNANLPPEWAAMTQDKWKDLSKMDPFVRSFDKNAAGQFLKGKKNDVIIRTFLSDAAGLKVAFTASEQAASLEETISSLEEISKTTPTSLRTKETRKAAPAAQDDDRVLLTNEEHG
jgi:hypothetical protein